MADETATDETMKLGSGEKDSNLIPGLHLVDTSKLHNDFRRVRGNQMYFVDRCTFYKQNGARGEEHIFVLSPGAFFLLNFNGEMERATVYPHIADLYQKKVKKGIIAFPSSEHHLLLKVPSEMDCHVSFASSAIYQRLIPILTKILETQRQKVVAVKEVPAGKDITDYFNDKPAEGYYTPREIAIITRQRSIFAKYICVGRQNVLDLQVQISRAKAQVSDRDAEVEGLRQRGVDEDSIRRRKTDTAEKQLELQRQVAAKHGECERVLSAIRTLQAKVLDARGNTDALMEKGVAAALAERVKERNETVALRRRAQQKEKAALEEEIATLRRNIAAQQPQQSAKAKAQEAALDEELVELEMELEKGFRLEKFLATVNGEIEAQCDTINALNKEKLKWINDREKSATGEVHADDSNLILADPLETLTGNGDENDMLL